MQGFSIQILHFCCKVEVKKKNNLACKDGVLYTEILDY